MQVTKGQSDLDGVEPCTLLCESSDLSQVREEFTSSDESHNEEDLLIGLEHVAHADKERMISLQKDILLQFG